MRCPSINRDCTLGHQLGSGPRVMRDQLPPAPVEPKPVATAKQMVVTLAIRMTPHIYWVSPRFMAMATACAVLVTSSFCRMF